jgi:SpoVK/Ycf46/Vps4 family AAA+-type ATPase
MIINFLVDNTADNYLESVAELTHKPFYPISTGELGTNAKVAESKLLAIFRRGERWGAVVLLDEADLFLAKRTSTELDRNALVNIFLRNLEYYQGLIFLTSNRVEEFDFAFDSRVHLHVNFEDPDAAVRTQIWKRFLPKTWEDSVAENLGRDLVVNGRVIKNLVRTATLLSEGDEHTLSEDLIRAVHENNVKVCATTTPSI